MAEPSKEVYQRVLALRDEHGVLNISDVARALQAVMDQAAVNLDWVRESKRVAEESREAHRQRAEKAEAELCSLKEMYRCAFCQQTEAFESRAVKAEARLAELVREVRSWWDTADLDVVEHDGVAFDTILRKYESPEPAKPERKCKVCKQPERTHFVDDGAHDFEPEDDHG